MARLCPSPGLDKAAGLKPLLGSGRSNCRSTRRRFPMSKAKKVGLSVLVLGGIGTAAFLLISKNAAAKQEGLKTVEIVRGTIVDKALAVGQIVPDQEIQVKSQISGIVKETLRRSRRPGRGRPAALLDQPRPDAARARRRRTRGCSSPRSPTTRRSRTSSARSRSGQRRHPGQRRSSTPAEGLRPGPHLARRRRRTSCSSSRKGRIQRKLRRASIR